MSKEIKYRNVTGDYRYNYQGQELDPETGKVAFQLRLYDARINRWLTTDPAGQYCSPYLSMGNNWVNGRDSDGAFWEELGNWFSGNGWHSNAALEYQAAGGVLNAWEGNVFTGGEGGFKDFGDGIVDQTYFAAVNDFGSAPRNYALDNIVSPPLQFGAYVVHSLALGFYGAGYLLNEGLHGREVEGLKVSSPYTVKIPKFINGEFVLELKDKSLTNEEIEHEIMMPALNTGTNFLAPTKFVPNKATNTVLNIFRDIMIGESIKEAHSQLHNQ